MFIPLFFCLIFQIPEQQAVIHWTFFPNCAKPKSYMGSHKWASCYTFHVRFASSSVFVFSKNRWAGMSLQRSPNPCPCPEDPCVQYSLLELSELWNVWSADQPCYIFTSFASLMFSNFSETSSSHTEVAQPWLSCVHPHLETLRGADPTLEDL